MRSANWRSETVARSAGAAAPPGVRPAASGRGTWLSRADIAGPTGLDEARSSHGRAEMIVDPERAACAFIEIARVTRSASAQFISTTDTANSKGTKP